MQGGELVGEVARHGEKRKAFNEHSHNREGEVATAEQTVV